jgi:hypothetical protein
MRGLAKLAGGQKTKSKKNDELASLVVRRRTSLVMGGVDETLEAAWRERRKFSLPPRDS